MEFSIVICTYNRASQVAMLVQSLCEQPIAAAHSREIIVVDNNSSDDTRAVAERAGALVRTESPA